MAFDIADLDRGSAFFWIDNKGRDFDITKEQAVLKVLEKKFTVKVEGMEHLDPDSETVHMFISPKKSKSFDAHTDEVDLKILCIEGRKGFEVDGTDVVLKKDHYVLVPKGTPHRAINKYASVILSVEVKIPEDYPKIKKSEHITRGASYESFH